MTKNISINKDVITHYINEKKLKTLYIYALTVYLTSGKGYIAISSYINILNQTLGISKRTASRWIDKIKDERLIKIKKRNIIVLSKKQLEKRLQTKSGVYIKVNDADFQGYSSFRNHIIQQLGLIVQDTFTHLHRRRSKKLATSLLKQGKIEADLALPKYKKKHGCSISQMTKRYKLSAGTVSNAFKGHTEEMYSGKGSYIKSMYKRGKKYRDNRIIRDIMDDITYNRVYTLSEIRRMGVDGKYYQNLSTRHKRNPNKPARKLLQRVRKYSHRFSYEYIEKHKAIILKYRLANKLTVSRQRYNKNNYTCTKQPEGVNSYISKGTSYNNNNSSKRSSNTKTTCNTVPFGLRNKRKKK